MKVPHTGRADKEGQELIRLSRTGRTPGMCWQKSSSDTQADESDLFKIGMCLYPSRRQALCQWNLISSNQGYVGSVSLQTQSVVCEQLKPGVYWSRSSSDTVNGISPVQSRGTHVVRSSQTQPLEPQSSNQLQAGHCGTTPFASHTQAVNYTVWKQERKKKHAFHGFALTCLWRLKWHRSITEPNWMTQIDRCAAETCWPNGVLSTRIQYKIALICFHVVSGTTPPYLSELLHLYSPSRSLRSDSDTRIFRVPRMGRRTLGERSFQYTGPVLWNSLPLSIFTLFF